MNLVLQGEGVIKESIIERGAINNASLDQNLLCLSMWSVIQIFGLCSVFFRKWSCSATSLKATLQEHCIPQTSELSTASLRGKNIQRIFVATLVQEDSEWVDLTNKQLHIEAGAGGSKKKLSLPFGPDIHAPVEPIPDNDWVGETWGLYWPDQEMEERARQAEDPTKFIKVHE